MENITWQGNSKKMYEAIIAETPPMIKGVVRKKVTGWINKNNINIVTEDLVFRAVDEIASASLSNKIKNGLDQLRS